MIIFYGGSYCTKENEIKRILSLYDVGDLIDYKGITQGIENTNYFLKTSNKEIYTYNF